MKILVTGGGGFLGQAIVRRLLARGDTVAVLNRSRYRELESQGVVCHQGDIAEPTSVHSAAEGCDAIIHVAARAGPGLRARDFERPNVDGTRNVLAACAAHGIRCLVHTSSPSVVHAGGDLEGADESLPYPRRFHAPYPETKARAERLVLAANGPELKTCALRPHLIWGPGDNQLVPRLIEKNRSGRLRLPAPDKKIDTVFIDNAALAHVLALDNLTGSGSAAGQAYFISNGEPMANGEIIAKLLRASGEQPRIRAVPYPLALAVAAAVEGLWRLTRRGDDPPLSRFVVNHLATAHWFDLTAARRDLGYEPEVSIDEGLGRLSAAAGGSASAPGPSA